ncbi:MAG TPA: metallophosphoesterase family protein [Candidatus Binatia bacterium]|nr:metallophosphoesterase family protein [Candidatus Binatia bacterium]
MVIGLISDTHAQLHPGVRRAFRGVDQIWHAGDVGSEAILDELAELAPVTAIHGNADPSVLQQRLPDRRIIRCASLRALLVHQAQAGRRWLPAVTELIARERPAVVVFGHSHVQYLDERDGVLFINPGGGGRRRFRLRRSVARLCIGGDQPRAQIVWLDAE